MSDYVNKEIKITEPETYAAIFNVGFVYLIRKGIESDDY